MCSRLKHWVLCSDYSVSSIDFSLNAFHNQVVQLCWTEDRTASCESYYYCTIQLRAGYAYIKAYKRAFRLNPFFVRFVFIFVIAVVIFERNILFSSKIKNLSLSRRFHLYTFLIWEYTFCSILIWMWEREKECEYVCVFLKTNQFHNSTKYYVICI